MRLSVQRFAHMIGNDMSTRRFAVVLFFFTAPISTILNGNAVKSGLQNVGLYENPK